MSVIYGINAAVEAVRAHPERIERISVERGLRNPRVGEIILEARQKRVRVSFEERAWLDRKADGERHQGIICHIAEADTLDAEEVLAGAKSPGLLAVLDGIEDPHNLGAIIRSAEASGLDGVFIPKNRSAGLSPSVVKASAGAAAHAKIARIGNTAQFIESLKKKGYWIFGLEAGAGKTIWEADLTVPAAFVLGGEGKGIHRLVKEKCDFLVSLPIYGNVSSFNVSVAAGIAFYEALRQRGLAKGSSE
ncbi:MAG: 23S rRNA (guanosine(2251)-2'-O)-methyltransferase RlmB [Acidobacteriota bacterium]|jgi:23S rRNA (guanosine2251-2'-O)-methyltransferase|nr:23S rRNA (guanosine(2251)-2'-O)-methyltransferase RlmB [Acidobacteriota bacterium]